MPAKASLYRGHGPAPTSISNQVILLIQNHTKQAVVILLAVLWG